MTLFHTLRLRASLLLMMAAAAAPVAAQNASFQLVGHIEAFALNAANDPLGGATMTVRGIPVTLPRNLLVTLPGQYLTPQDLFRGPALGAVQASSGLALADPTPPKVAFEAELMGNIVGTRYIAGVARISQGGLHVGSGFIQAIDNAKGELRIGVAGGATGARVRLNDPRGIYGVANGAGAKAALPLDARFALDPDNSPVHARTGFPVCIERAKGADALCPAANRPGGADDRRYTCAGATLPLKPSAEPLAPAHRCDPSLPAPLKEGDFVTYVGMLVPDPAGGFVVAAHGLEAELGIYTSPGAEPVYVFIEEALQGTLGEPFADIPQEETTRVRIVGFTTDPSRAVEITLVDSDRAGKETPLTGPAGLRPSNGPQLGRFRNTWPAKDNARAVRRDIQARVVGASLQQQPTTKLTSGLYVAPIGEYIAPEATRFGVRGFQPAVPFENFCYLDKAGGGFKTVSGDVVLGRLDPFPDSGHATSQVVGAGPSRACAPE